MPRHAPVRQEKDGFLDQDAEATHCHVRAAPGAVFARLTRRSGDGIIVRGMHVELTPAQALQLAKDLSECAKIAIARDTAPEELQSQRSALAWPERTMRPGMNGSC